MRCKTYSLIYLHTLCACVCVSLCCRNRLVRPYRPAVLHSEVRTEYVYTDVKCLPYLRICRDCLQT
jgi:hypothetical protein